MATDRKLIVAVVGDDSSLQRSLTRSTAAITRFGQTADRSLSRTGVSVSKSFDPLLANTRKMQAEADALSQRLTVMDDGLSRSGKSAGALSGSMVGLIGRAGLAGLALNTAYQASRALSDALTTTGEEAFTTTGRLKNMGAALVNMDLISAFAALRAAPKTLEELGISATEAGNRMKALTAVASGQAAQLRETGDYEKYNRLVEEAGTANQKLARELVGVVSSMRAAEAAQNALADATARVGSVFETSTGQVVAFKGAVDDRGGLRGPGLVDSINAALKQAAAGAGSSGRLARPIGPTAKNAAAQVIAAANNDLDALLRLQVVERDRLAKALANSTGNVQQRETLNAQLASARASVINTERALAGDAAARAAAAEAARKTAVAAGEAARRAAAAEAQAAREEAARLAALLEQRRKAAEQVRQFRLLGLSGTGDEIVPGIQNLQTRIGAALRRIQSGEIDVSSKLVSRLKLARKAIRTEGKGLSEETRDTINELIKTVAGGAKRLDQASGGGPRTATSSLRANKILAGLGLSRDVEKELRARLSSFNSAGLAVAGMARPSGTFRGGVVVENHNTITLDGDVVARNTTRSQQKRKRRNPTQKRGPNGGV